MDPVQVLDMTTIKSKLKSLDLSEVGTLSMLYERLSTYLHGLTIIELKKMAPKGVRKAQTKDKLIGDIILSPHDFILEIVDGVKIIPVTKTLSVIPSQICTSTNSPNKLVENAPKQRTSTPKILKEQVWKTYVGSSIETKCPVCNDKTITAFDFDCDHVIAHQQGGQSTVENLRPTCRSCNLSMATQNLESFCNQFFPNAPVLKTFTNKEQGNNCILS